MSISEPENTDSAALATQSDGERAEGIANAARSALAIAEREAVGAELTRPDAQYAIKFLAFASTVPFRRLALLQELNDIFEFSGTFDPPFLNRWKTLSEPEKDAFGQCYREFKRMEALEVNFTGAGRATSEKAPLEERASHFVAAHAEGLEDWQNALRAEENATPNSAALVKLFPNTELPEPASSASRPGESPAEASASLLDQMIPTGDKDIRTVLESLAPMDGLAKAVLEDMCSAEIREARSRFLTRVRWMLGLPNPQRIAIALRTVGKKRREIAKEMGLSEQTVKSHLARADADWTKFVDAEK